MSKKLLFGDKMKLIVKFTTSSVFSDIASGTYNWPYEYIYDYMPVFNDNYIYAFRYKDYEVDRESIDGQPYRENIYDIVSIFSKDDFDSISFKGKEIYTIDYLKITPNVTNMRDIFHDVYQLSLINLTHCDTSNVTDMSGAFSKNYNLKKIEGINNLDTGKVTDMSYMFSSCDSLTELDLSNWNTSNVKDMGYMFCYGYAGTNNTLTKLDLSNWNTVKVEDMTYMFGSLLALTTINGIGNWDTSSIKNIEGIFYNCESLTSLDLSKWDTSNVISMYGIFSSCHNLSLLDVSTWNTSNVTDMRSVFNDCNSLTPLDISNWRTENVTDMSYMLSNCESLTSLDLSKWDTSSVKNIEGMLSNCESLTSLDLSKWDVSNVTNMSYMFSNCKQLTSVGDISNWNTSNVFGMRGLFEGCTSLTSFNVIDWDVSKAIYMEDMFQGCTLLTSIDLSNWKVNGNAYLDGMFQGCTSLTSIDLSNWDLFLIHSKTDMFYGCESLTSIKILNTTVSSINHLISVLPDRSNSEEPGIVEYYLYNTIGIMDTEKAEAKNWKLKFLQEITLYADKDTVKKGETVKLTYGFTPSDYKFDPEVEYVIKGDAEVYNDGLDDILICNSPGIVEVYLRNVEYHDLVSNTITITVTDRTVYTFKFKTENSAYKYDGDYTYFYVNSEKQYVGDCTLADGVFIYLSESPITHYELGNIGPLTEIVEIDLSNVTDMSYMFGDSYTSNTLLTSLDLSDWDTSKVTNMRGMFDSCEALTSVGDLSNWNTSKVTDMSYMFYNCPLLTSLNLSNWDTSSVTDMTGIFGGCDNLSYINFSNIKYEDSRIAMVMPDRSSKTPGTVVLPEGFSDQTIINFLTSKNWEITFS